MQQNKYESDVIAFAFSRAEFAGLPAIFGLPSHLQNSKSGAKVSGHDFSRAISALKSNELQPLW
jgi:hypothetical protein